MRIGDKKLSVELYPLYLFCNFINNGHLIVHVAYDGKARKKLSEMFILCKDLLFQFEIQVSSVIELIVSPGSISLICRAGKMNCACWKGYLHILCVCDLNAVALSIELH